MVKNKPISINRYIGVELEVSEATENSRMPMSGAWRKDWDGSVRNFGREYKMTNKMIGKPAIDAIQEICNYFSNDSSITTENVGNGFHLHLDYTGYPIDNALNLCDFAYSIQDWMYYSVYDSRHNNSFCSKYDRVPSVLFETSARERVESMLRSSWISPYNMRNGGRQTVEVRLHHGTGNCEDILTWIEWWTVIANLCDKGKLNMCFSKRQRQAMLDSLPISPETYSRFSYSLIRTVAQC